MKQERPGELTELVEMLQGPSRIEVPVVREDGYDDGLVVVSVDDFSLGTEQATDMSIKMDGLWRISGSGPADLEGNFIWGENHATVTLYTGVD